MPSDFVKLLTGPGIAAIAVIRLSGPGIDGFLAQHFSKQVSVGKCVHGILHDEDRVIDDVIAVRFGNHLDLNLHGGTWVVQSILQLAKDSGFAASDIHAIDGNTELWREVLAALPHARTEQALRMLLAQPGAWESVSDPRKVLNDSSGRWLIEQPRVAIVGPPNVGKSTLANQLFGQDRSITADLPGTTRDWVGEIANLDGLAVMLLDTPGQRATDDPLEDAAIAGSKDQIRAADLVVLVLDQSLPLNDSMLQQYPDAIRVANKSDAGANWDAAELPAIRTVATTGAGVGELLRAIRRHFGWDPLEVNQPRWWTHRQQQSLQQMALKIS